MNASSVNAATLGLEDIDRLDLAISPTPLQEAPSLAKEIGIGRLLVKRDDNTGLALGGNKARKLEYLMADAVAVGADVVVTTGGPQSNHCRMTAAAARQCKMDAILVFPGPPIEAVQGNLVLAELFGAQWRFAPDGLERHEYVKEVMGSLVEEGRNPYSIPAGGTNGLGILGYVRAALELADQFRALDVVPSTVVTAVGSCGTYAGLLLGAKIAGLSEVNVVGISVSNLIQDKEGLVRSLVSDATDILKLDTDFDYSIRIERGYVGEGYGLATDDSEQARYLAAREEGLILDHVYTAKAMAGLIDLAKKGDLGANDNVVFMHTGGAPALFADRSLYWDGS